ncbi:NAD(P)/FAD-dependent oxidoreductase [Actinophytocola oryzae]|uniref:Flavin-dependent dehydrogenase n=1 Tax=Actinophytocola oryzae TaxID=502181 RepID=A0A4R7VWC7_9PSEU|nr:NAD(P)-binding protein [Actinophytocola oryzae]TDV54244.1 flavin-dependent dehydrogenase [Actinophytocola oryzae]
MSPVVVVGGSVAGLATALALARAGRAVLVLDRAAAPPEGVADEVAPEWNRPSVPHAQQAHTLTSLGVAVLRDHAPDVLADAVASGAELLDLVTALPPGLGGRVAGDDELVALACRRTVLELVLVNLVRATAGVEVRHGVRVSGLLTAGRGTRVAGVVTDTGERVAAEIVVDATGRRARARSWLAALGHRLPPDSTGRTGVRVHSRFYRRRTRPGPLNRGNAAGVVADHYAGVLHPADGDLFSVALGTHPSDHALAALRQPRAFQAVASATPYVEEWLADAVPYGDVHVTTCPPNVFGALAGAWPQPLAGLFPVGDAACVTDPLFGRGMSLAIAHAFRLAEVLDAGPEVGEAQSKEAVRAALDLFTPWYQQAYADSEERADRWRRAVTGEPPPPEGPRLGVRAVGRAAPHDAEVWRGLTRVLMGLCPAGEVFADAGFAARVRRVLADTPRASATPTRHDLLTTVSTES